MRALEEQGSEPGSPRSVCRRNMYPVATSTGSPQPSTSFGFLASFDGFSAASLAAWAASLRAAFSPAFFAAFS